MSKRRRTSMDSLRVDNANLRRELELLNGDVTVLIEELNKVCEQMRRQDHMILTQTAVIRRLAAQRCQWRIEKEKK